jgi:hypothetical protein
MKIDIFEIFCHYRFGKNQATKCTLSSERLNMNEENKAGSVKVGLERR